MWIDRYAIYCGPMKIEIFRSNIVHRDCWGYIVHAHAKCIREGANQHPGVLVVLWTKPIRCWLLLVFVVVGGVTDDYRGAREPGIENLLVISDTLGN